MTRARKGFIKEMTKRNLASAKAVRRLLSVDVNVVFHSRSLHILNFKYELEYALLYLCVKYIFWDAYVLIDIYDFDRRQCAGK